MKPRNKKALYAKVAKLRLRNRILKHYGTICMDCGISEEKVLVIPITHKYLGSDTKSYYYDIVRNNYPDCIEILCRNCSYLSTSSIK